MYRYVSHVDLASAHVPKNWRSLIGKKVNHARYCSVGVGLWVKYLLVFSSFCFVVILQVKKELWEFVQKSGDNIIVQSISYCVNLC